MEDSLKGTIIGYCFSPQKFDISQADLKGPLIKIVRKNGNGKEELGFDLGNI